jgi:hypothetical protein
MRHHSLSIFILSLLTAVLLYVAAQAEQEKQQTRSASTQSRESSRTDKALEEKILALERQVNQLINRRDQTALRSLTADEFLYVDGQGIAGKLDFLSGVSGSGKADITDFRMEEAKVVELGKEAALIAYGLTAKGTRNGKEFLDQGYASSVWVNRGGKWLNVFSQFTPAKQEAPAR